MSIADGPVTFDSTLGPTLRKIRSNTRPKPSIPSLVPTLVPPGTPQRVHAELEPITL